MSSSKGQDFRTVLEEICKIKDETVHIPMPEKKWTTAGEIVGNDYSVAYRILDAQYFGVLKDAEESFLSQILQENVPEKYYLSQRACSGILRRASARGKELPELLERALEKQAQYV